MEIHIDYKSILASIPLFLLIIGFFRQYISTIGILEVELLFLSKDKRIFAYLNEFLRFSFIFIGVSFYVALIINLFSSKESRLFVKIIPSFMQKAITGVLSIALILLLSYILLKYDAKLFKKFKSIKILKIIYIVLNLSIFWISYISLLVLFSSVIIENILSKNFDFYNCLIPASIACFLSWSIYKFCAMLKNLYRKHYFKILVIKTKSNDFFRNLYLHSQNDKYIILQHHKNRDCTDQHLLINKDTIEYYMIQREDTFWDQPMSSDSKEIRIKGNFIPRKPVPSSSPDISGNIRCNSNQGTGRDS